MKRTPLLASIALATGSSLAGLTLVAAPVAAQTPPIPIDPTAALEVFGIDLTGFQLVKLDTASLSTPSTPRSITGLQSGETIKGIDVRPTTGQLFALGSTSRLYTLNPATAAATAVGGPFTPQLVGSDFGFDFNPVVDRIRVVSNTGQNLRLNPVTGAATNDAPINGAAAVVIGSAYTNSAGTAASTALYDVSTNGSLYLQDPPNAGTTTLVGPTGLGAIGAGVGFDILKSGASNTGLISALPSPGAAGLFRVNLATGAATRIGDAPALSSLAIAGPSGYCGADFDAEVRCVGGAGGAREAVGGLVESIVDAVQTPSGQGVTQVAFDGGIITSGDAGFFGSAGGLPLAEEVVGLTATPTGLGYWLVGADGGVFSYGDATFFGSVPGVLAPGQELALPVVGIASTATGKGYWMIAEDGGVFAFGDATFFGSVPGVLAPGQQLEEAVIGLARSETGPGYYMVAFDGGVFNFGAPFLGSAGGADLVAPVTDIAAAGPTGGYRLLAADGGIFNYGGASFRGPIPDMDFAVGLAG